LLDACIPIDVINLLQFSIRRKSFQFFLIIVENQYRRKNHKKVEKLKE